MDRFDYIYVRDGSKRIKLESADLIFDQKVSLSSEPSDYHYLSDHFGLKVSITLY